MEIVASDAAPRLSPADAQDTLREMAAVVRALFGVGLQNARPEIQPQAQPEVAPAPAAAPSLAPPSPRPATPAPAAPGLPVPGLAVPGLPVPGLPVPAAPAAVAAPALPLGDPEERPEPATAQQPLDRHSLSLLQEIAFLDD